MDEIDSLPTSSYGSEDKHRAVDFLMHHHKRDLEETLLLPLEQTKSYAIVIDFINLHDFDPDFAERLLVNPRHSLTLCDEAAIAAQEDILSAHEDEPTASRCTVKRRVRARIRGVPQKPVDCEIGELVSVTGTVIGVKPPRVTITEQSLECIRTQETGVAKLEWERGIMSIRPRQCNGCRKMIKYPKSDERHEVKDSKLIDVQEVKLRLRASDNNGPSSRTDAVRVVLTEDLVDACQNGDEIEISGYVLLSSPEIEEQKVCLTDTFLFANWITRRNAIPEKSSLEGMPSNGDEIADRAFRRFWHDYEQDPLVGRDLILESVCPQICGMYDVKLALALVLAGGVPKNPRDGESQARQRGDCHLLLCGDPGTGKSQIMKAAADLAKRAVSTTGMGSTQAGLTAAAIKDKDGTWQLEAGALVLCNGGICCIDEFATMGKSDADSILEAMESQTISIAKAGIATTLVTRCSIVAALNPTNGDMNKIPLSEPLLSRFDIVLYLKDHPDPEWDQRVSRHIIEAAMKTTTRKRSGGDGEEDPVEPLSQDVILGDMEVNGRHGRHARGKWRQDVLRRYFAYVRDAFQPTFTEEASDVIQAAFMFHRQQPSDEGTRALKTMRMLNAMSRLAQAHAKIMYRDRVLLMDAIYAIRLMEVTLRFHGDPNSSRNRPFPDNPKIKYIQDGTEILERLDQRRLIERL